MPDINDIHRFYEANLPGYERKDLVRINKFFLAEMKLVAKKPISAVLNNWDRFKRFVAIDWFGWDEIGSQKLLPEPILRPNKGIKIQEYGKCNCGGFMVKRQNREDKSYFLGCSMYPKCKKTKPLLD